ncbi:phage holin family protein [Kineococcus sp. DHX-1]|uniref:phage holin family protein n=1 Tax=Kineococcus sp. DHX-1 TaxID=3349638 RepID=UPI0036D2F625
MTQPTGSGIRTDDLSVSHGPGPTPSTGEHRREESVGQLVSQLTEQVSRLVKDEVQLAKVDLTAKGKKAGIGIGMFSGAGLLAFFGFGALVTTAILGLAYLVPAWVSALIVGVVLFAVAAVLAVMGKKEVSEATPPVPQAAVDGLKQDVQTVKEGLHR